MAQVLHGSARTTAAIRRAIQDSQESLRALAKRHGINPKTVAKWRQRGTVRISVCGRAVEHYAAMALMNRSPKMTANCALAMDHSRGSIFPNEDSMTRLIGAVLLEQNDEYRLQC